MKIFIAGVNGFIGNCLVRRILEKTDWQALGLDLESNKLEHSIESPRFHFFKGDICTDTEKVDELIAEADVGLIPFDDNFLWKNAFTTKFFEYCACGLPVIATVYEDSLLAKLIKEHDIGLVTPPLDEEKLAEAIYWVYKNKAFREASGKKARLLVEKHFDRIKLSINFLEVIQETLKD